MERKLHLDEARDGAVETLRSFLARDKRVARAVVIDDLFGRIRVVIWLQAGESQLPSRDDLEQALGQACAQYWTGDLWVSNNDQKGEEQSFYDKLWSEGLSLDGEDRLRLNDRHRSRAAWFLPIAPTALWDSSEGPPILIFHSFKGGVGRTTALTAYAIAHARRGERVAVVDFDLDAPGLGRLLDSDGAGTTARWGVTDFLLESSDNLPLDQYLHLCARNGVTGEGTIEVFPAGRMDATYIEKLARMDLESSPGQSIHPLFHLLNRIRDERQPTLILIDGRAGLSPAAGLLLSGFAHLHVLFATTNAQSLAGLERIVHHLGYVQARRGLPQAECIVAQAMVPDNSEVAAAASANFDARVEQIFRDNYYAAQSDPEDRLWSIDDLASGRAPHRAVPIRYRGTFAFFTSIDQIADALLTEGDYSALAERLDERLALPSTSSS